MSVTATPFISSSTSFHLSTKYTNKILFTSIAVPTSKFSTLSTCRPVWFRVHYGSSKKTSMLSRFKPFIAPVMEWQDCTVKMDIDVPVSVAYNRYLDRESIPKWMPFISSVKILEDKPDLSRWSLKYEAFGQNIEYSWLARNMQPIPNQKIHWRSLEGLPNSRAVRFFPKGPKSCSVNLDPYTCGFTAQLTVSYEVPQLLVPVASALKPFLEGLLKSGLERFTTFAKSSLSE